MGLYNVQDSDRPIWVFAASMAGAIAAWRALVVDENGPYESTADPEGVIAVADDGEIFAEDGFPIQRLGSIQKGQSAQLPAVKAAEMVGINIAAPAEFLAKYAIGRRFGAAIEYTIVSTLIDRLIDNGYALQIVGRDDGIPIDVTGSNPETMAEVFSCDEEVIRAVGRDGRKGLITLTYGGDSFYVISDYSECLHPIVESVMSGLREFC